VPLDGGVANGHFCKIPVVSIDYREAPQYHAPAATDDVVAVWRELLKSRPAASTALGGISAGGGLALAVPQLLRELGLDQPGALMAGTPGGYEQARRRASPTTVSTKCSSAGTA
jgi:epsilon-lactone hydrolase